MGFIDQAEAQRRRKQIEKEAGFYGAMDGASKFVKGDAIAGIIMMPPTTVALPLKVLMFVLVDGWALILKALVGSFH